MSHHLSNDFPCIGTYEEFHSKCFDCPVKRTCIAETEADDGSYAYAAVNSAPKKRVVIRQPQQQIAVRNPSAIGNVFHNDFEPYVGENRPTRFFKNMGLDLLVTAASSLATFARDFQWMPPEPEVKRVTLEVVEEKKKASGE